MCALYVRVSCLPLSVIPTFNIILIIARCGIGKGSDGSWLPPISGWLVKSDITTIDFISLPFLAYLKRDITRNVQNMSQSLSSPIQDCCVPRQRGF